MSHDETVDETAELERIACARELATTLPAAETTDTTEAKAPEDAANIDIEDGDPTAEEVLAGMVDEIAKTWRSVITQFKLGEVHPMAQVKPLQKALHPSQQIKVALVGASVPMKIMQTFLTVYDRTEQGKAAKDRAPNIEKKNLVIVGGPLPKQ